MQRTRIQREYISKGHYTELIMTKLNGSEYVVKLDTEDVPKISQYKWNIREKNRTNNTNYARMQVHGDEKSWYVFMHRLIMSFPENMQIDHLNGDGLDNRKSNLRIVSCRENCITRERSASKQGKYGHRGVSFRKGINKFTAHIGHKYKKINLGHYENIEDAIKARKEGEVKYFNL